MDADYYLETIRTVFQEFALVNGTWDVHQRERRARARAARGHHAPRRCFTIEGELDDISGSGQTEAAHSLCTGVPKARQKHFEVKGAGHYGIFSGRRWREIVYPQVRDFIAALQPGPGACTRPAAQRAAKAAGRARRPRPTCGVTALAARLHAALPQTQCTRCGYPDCAGYAAGHGGGRGRASTSARPAAPKASRGWPR